MMAGARWATAAVLLAAPLALAQSANDRRTRWPFDDLPSGQPAPGFLYLSGAKDPASGPDSGAWLVARDGGSGVLTHAAQRSAGPAQRGAGVHLAIAQGTSLENMSLSTRLRTQGGARTAGLVWRYRDQENYYLTTLDLADQRVRIYRVAGGNRTRLEDEDDLELDQNAWHLLKVEHRGTRMRVWIDGVPVSDARDRTWQGAGAVGVWVTADSTVWFDDLTVEPIMAGDRRRESPKAHD